MLVISDFGTWCCFNFFYMSFSCRMVCHVFFTFLKRWVWYQIFHHRIDIVDSHRCLVNQRFVKLRDLQLVASKTVLIFPSQLGVLKDTFENVLQDTFQTVFQTFLVTVVDFFGVGHFVLFLLFLLRKRCTILQFQFFEITNLQLSKSCVLVSPATQNVDWAATKE